MAGTRGSTCGQLLLFATLLFGIFTMHTVGHPAEHGGPGLATRASHPHVMADAAGRPAPATQPLPAAALRHDPPAPMPGMDPMAVCLAVLGTWGLALVALLLLVRRYAGLGPGSAPPWSPLLSRPPPPPPPRPRKAVLTGLSVLRI
ncbi:hypothetical protein [Streptomyces sp. NBC_01022]|uniref:hypothetical protein n=1 Tax=Streptomyces sp. NBC_01022 TaxID=2903723 RepID=UPI002DD8AEAE|nr:hypothetical protein [Streptomyces sp. NBC_01022]WRZ81410.1 hypothetical protein OG316_14590 [Streptomyces sp. NBC_01022]